MTRENDRRPGVLYIPTPGDWTQRDVAAESRASTATGGPGWTEEELAAEARRIEAELNRADGLPRVIPSTDRAASRQRWPVGLLPFAAAVAFGIVAELLTYRAPSSASGSLAFKGDPVVTIMAPGVVPPTSVLLEQIGPLSIQRAGGRVACVQDSSEFDVLVVWSYRSEFGHLELTPGGSFCFGADFPPDGVSWSVELRNPDDRLGGERRWRIPVEAPR